MLDFILLIVEIDLDIQSEQHELLSDITDDFVGDHLQEVEVDGLGQRSALTDHGNISFLNGESRGAVNGDVSVSLFIPVVFGDVVEVISSHNDSSLHFGWDDNTLEDLTSDGNVGGEGAFLVNVSWFYGFLGGSDAKSDIFVEPDSSAGLLGQELLAVQEHILLFLEGSLVLSLRAKVLDYQPSMSEY